MSLSGFEFVFSPPAPIPKCFLLKLSWSRRRLPLYAPSYQAKPRKAKREYHSERTVTPVGRHALLHCKYVHVGALTTTMRPQGESVQAARADNKLNNKIKESAAEPPSQE